MQTVKPYRVGNSRGVPCVLVRSIDSKETFNPGGKNYRFRYEYGINLYGFEREEENDIKHRLGLDDEQYHYWLKRLREVTKCD